MLVEIGQRHAARKQFHRAAFRILDARGRRERERCRVVVYLSGEFEIRQRNASRLGIAGGDEQRQRVTRPLEPERQRLFVARLRRLSQGFGQILRFQCDDSGGIHRLHAHGGIGVDAYVAMRQCGGRGTQCQRRQGFRQCVQFRLRHDHDDEIRLRALGFLRTQHQ